MSCTTSWITSLSTSLSISTSYSYSYSSTVYTYNNARAAACRSFDINGEGEGAPTPTSLALEFLRTPTGAGKRLRGRQTPSSTPAPTPVAAGNSPLNVIGIPPTSATATAAPVVRREVVDSGVSPINGSLLKRQIGGLDGSFCPISAPYRFGSAQCGQERCYTNPTLECTPTEGTSRFMRSGDCDACYWYTPGLTVTSLVGTYSVRPGSGPVVLTNYYSSSYPYYYTSTVVHTSIYAGDVRCSSNGLSTGAIVGIAVGAAGLLGALLVALLTWFLLLRRKPAPTSPKTDASYTPAKLDQEFSTPAPSPLPLENEGQLGADSPESQGVFHREEPGTIVHW